MLGSPFGKLDGSSWGNLAVDAPSPMIQAFVLEEFVRRRKKDSTSRTRRTRFGTEPRSFCRTEDQ